VVRRPCPQINFARSCILINLAPLTSGILALLRVIRHVCLHIWLNAARRLAINRQRATVRAQIFKSEIKILLVTCLRAFPQTARSVHFKTNKIGPPLAAICCSVNVKILLRTIWIKTWRLHIRKLQNQTGW